jgi:RNase P subunit RPR2
MKKYKRPISKMERIEAKIKILYMLAIASAKNPEVSAEYARQAEALEKQYDIVLLDKTSSPNT